jgi:hypothetical protein
VTGPSPLLDFFKRGEVARDIRLLAAQGALAPRAEEQLAILIILVEDRDSDVCTAAQITLNRIPVPTLAAFLAQPEVGEDIRAFFTARGIVPVSAPPGSIEEPLVDTDPEDLGAADEPPATLAQRLAKMGFSARLKAALKGSREMRAILIRDANKMISAAVLSSPRVNEQEIESYARMANVSDDVLRIIGSNRAWTKNYGIVVGLTRNPKTPVAISMNLMPRLTDRDLQKLSIDRNVPEPLRMAARRRVAGGPR